MSDGKVCAFYLADHLIEKPSSPADLMRRYYCALREYGVSKGEARGLAIDMRRNITNDLSTGGAFDKLLEGELKDEQK